MLTDEITDLEDDYLSSSRPSSMSTIRLGYAHALRTAISRMRSSWVTNKIVQPCSLARVCIKLTTSRPDLLSRAAVGSSAKVIPDKEYTHILHQYIVTNSLKSQNMRKRAWKNIDENSEHHSPVRPINTLHVVRADAQSLSET